MKNLQEDSVLEAADLNGDGVVTDEELSKGFPKGFPKGLC